MRKCKRHKHHKLSHSDWISSDFTHADTRSLGNCSFKTEQSGTYGRISQIQPDCVADLADSLFFRHVHTHGQIAEKES